MKRRKFYVEGFWLLLLLIPGCGRDFSAPPGPGTVTGSLGAGEPVSQPVAGARLRLLECGLAVDSDAQGDFRFDAVPSGDYRLRIVAGAALGGTEQYLLELPDPVLVRAPGLTSLGNIQVLPAGKVQGQVTIADGTSALNTSVYVVSGDALTHAGDQGNFLLEAVPAGTWRVSAARPGYMLPAPREVAVRSGEVASVDLELAPIPAGARGGIAGVVTLGNPGPEPGVSVILIDRFIGTRYPTVTNAAGGFRLEQVPVGYYQLVASHQGYRTVGLPNLEIRDGEVLDVPALVLPPDDGSPQGPADADPNGNLDDDGDAVPDLFDNCPVIPNPRQIDSDGNGVGDACEANQALYNRDGDGVEDVVDNCPQDFNPDQANHDDDPLGDLCDPDDDNDGLLDEPDPCPLVTDPGGDPNLCTWTLVYSGRDADGAIQLYLREMSPRDDTAHAVPLTAGPGQAWGAFVFPGGGGSFVYFHRQASASDPFRVCRIDLQVARLGPVTNPECFFLGEGDTMNPALCAAGEPILLYEQFVVDHWGLFAAHLPPAGQPPPGLPVNLEPFHQPPPLRPHSYRYPFCIQSEGLFYLAYSTDFGPRSPALDWNSWRIEFDPQTLQPTVQTWVFPIPVGENPNAHERRPSAFNLGNMAGWFYDVERQGRTDITSLPIGDQMAADLVADGAHNLEPAVHPMGGLLAYQSDRSGSSDIYVLSLASGSTVRVTDDAGWEGSPAWVK